jgi:hypothetical protein
MSRVIETYEPPDQKVRDLPRVDAPHLSAVQKLIPHVQCEGEPPLEALRNSGMC